MVRASASDLAVLGVTEGDLVLVAPVSLDEIDDGSVIVAEVGGDSAFHRFSRNGRGVHLEALQPGGGTTHVEDADTLHVIGRVAGFYRRMDEIPAITLTQH
jgi:SOS-response transcriptional repressor LexA